MEKKLCVDLIGVLFVSNVQISFICSPPFLLLRGTFHKTEDEMTVQEPSHVTIYVPRNLCGLLYSISSFVIFMKVFTNSKISISVSNKLSPSILGSFSLEKALKDSFFLKEVDGKRHSC